MRDKGMMFMLVCTAIIFAMLFYRVETVQQYERLQEETRIAQEIALQESKEQAEYIGNVNSYKLHRLECSHLPYEENRIYFASRVEAIRAGYQPCEWCKP